MTKGSPLFKTSMNVKTVVIGLLHNYPFLSLNTLFRHDLNDNLHLSKVHYCPGSHSGPLTCGPYLTFASSDDALPRPLPTSPVWLPSHRCTSDFRRSWSYDKLPSSSDLVHRFRRDWRPHWTLTTYYRHSHDPLLTTVYVSVIPFVTVSIRLLTSPGHVKFSLNTIHLSIEYGSSLLTTV